MDNDDIKKIKSIPIRLIEQEEASKNLGIILPGRNYTVQAPLLHFATRILLKKGFDVLRINYNLNLPEWSSLHEKDLAGRIQDSIHDGIKNNNYNNIYIVAKSIGTIYLSYLLEDSRWKDAKLVWLTPLLQSDDVYHTMLEATNKGICIIGNKDYCYIEERIDQLIYNKNLALSIADKGNHILEIQDDPIKSIDLLKKVVMDMNEFIQYEKALRN